MLAGVLSPTASMALLLRLLLITLLLVNTSASAWAATGMAASLTTATTGSAHHISDSTDVAMASDCHNAPAADAPMPCGNDSQHCDCQHACSALPTPLALWLPLIPRAGPQTATRQAAASPHLADPVRPPIPFHA